VFIELWPVKGGVGTSVIAATLACSLPKQGESVLIMTKNTEEVADQVAIFGRSAIDVEKWDHPYHLADIHHGGDEYRLSHIYISASWYNQWYQPKPDDQQFDHTIVIRTPQMQKTKSMFPPSIKATKIQLLENSYLALSRSVKTENEYDLSIVLTTEHSPLQMKDVTTVLTDTSHQVFEWKRDAAVQRALDAGVYTSTRARHRNQSFVPITNHIIERNSYASNK
jgi:hypothetical protein